MKKQLLFIAFLINAAISNAQITITNADFATAGDTFRISTSGGFGITDLDSTGPNRIWDYSNLTALSQTIDTFVSVSSTPILYQFYFNNQFLYPLTKATVATKINVPLLPPGVPLTLSNAFGFYKVNSTAFSQVGFGATISGLPTSIPYDSLDFVYRFPMNFGNTDSCNYKFQLSIPNIGYLRRRAKRVNEVDGWGTLITPFGTFSTLRIKSTTYATDTVYISQLMFGTQIVQQPAVEYKWIGTNGGIPYLTINASADSIPIITTVRYQDSIRPVISIGVNEIKNQLEDLTLYPNPTDGAALLSFHQEKAGKVYIEIYESSGKFIRTLFEANLPEGLNYLPVDLSKEAKGLYFVRVKNDDFSISKKINRL
jgi:hypothetical protein